MIVWFLLVIEALCRAWRGNGWDSVTGGDGVTGICQSFQRGNTSNTSNIRLRNHGTRERNQRLVVEQYVGLYGECSKMLCEESLGHSVTCYPVTGPEDALSEATPCR